MRHEQTFSTSGGWRDVAAVTVNSRSGIGGARVAFHSRYGPERLDLPGMMERYEKEPGYPPYHPAIGSGAAAL